MDDPQPKSPSSLYILYIYIYIYGDNFYSKNLDANAPEFHEIIYILLLFILVHHQDKWILGSVSFGFR